VFALLLTGLVTSLSLIVVIGAQNAFVLRQGLRGEHVPWIVAVCALSDIVLMAMGTAGLDQISRIATWIVPVMTWFGFVFLIVYGVFSLRRAFRSEALHEAAGGAPLPLGRSIATALAMTWLNPHVYLDTVLLLGSLALTHQPLQWWFTVGAMAGSVLWFSLLGFGARWLRPLFAKPMAWRVLDIAIAIVVWMVALSLVI
jgi:L-lysine exporter family protein LysE/ArgO